MNAVVRIHVDARDLSTGIDSVGPRVQAPGNSIAATVCDPAGVAIRVNINAPHAKIPFDLMTLLRCSPLEIESAPPPSIES